MRVPKLNLQRDMQIGLFLYLTFLSRLIIIPLGHQRYSWQNQFLGSFGAGATMLIHRHGQATTMPKVRAAGQASADAGAVLAERFGGATAAGL